MQAQVILGFKNLSLMDSSKFIKDAILIIQDNLIVFCDSNESFVKHNPFNNQENILWTDCKGQWVTPGFINGHTHVAMSFMRDLAHDKTNMIENFFFPIEKKLTEDDVYLFSFPSICAGIKSGVTSFVDHYYHINGLKNALNTFGARGFLAETLADLGGAFPRRSNPEDYIQTEDWLKNKSSSNLVEKILGPHAMDTVSLDYISEISELSKRYNIPLHMHLSQTQNEFTYCQKKYTKSPVQVAYEAGALNSNSLAVHLIKVSDEDLKILKSSNCHIGLCPSSQIFYEHLAPIDKFNTLNIPGILGTDCAASHDSMDIMAELRTLYLLYRNLKRQVSPQDILKTVWDHPATWLNRKIGRLEAGYLADLVFFSTGLECQPMNEPFSHFINSMSSRHVEHVMINGEFILKEKELTKIDEVVYIDKIQNLAKKKFQF